jgi:hypothetical protein
MISKDIKIPADNISSWSTSSRRTVFNCRANVEQRKVSEVPSRHTKANSFQNRRSEFRTKVNLIMVNSYANVNFYFVIFILKQNLELYYLLLSSSLSSLWSSSSSYHRFCCPWYFSSWANGEPHHSGFKFQNVAFPLLCSLCGCFCRDYYYYYYIIIIIKGNISVPNHHAVCCLVTVVLLVLFLFLLYCL